MNQKLTWLVFQRNMEDTTTWIDYKQQNITYAWARRHLLAFTFYTADYSKAEPYKHACVLIRRRLPPTTTTQYRLMSCAMISKQFSYPRYGQDTTNSFYGKFKRPSWIALCLARPWRSRNILKTMWGKSWKVPSQGKRTKNLRVSHSLWHHLCLWLRAC